MKFHFDSYVKNWKKKKPKTEDKPEEKTEEIDLFADEKPEDKPEGKTGENKQEDGAEPDAKKAKVDVEDPEEEIEKLENFLKLLREENSGKYFFRKPGMQVFADHVIFRDRLSRENV